MSTAAQNIESVDAGVLREHLAPFANADCTACDGQGVFYGNVCVCHCVLDRMQAASEQIDEHKSLCGAYVRLMEAGRDRIIGLGGQCDPVDVMEHNDVYLAKSRAAIARATGDSA